MKIVYSLPHPADRLVSQHAGHVIRANALLDALATYNHQIIRIEAATEQSTKTAVAIYRNVIKKLLPRPIAMRMRDAARVANSKRYALRLIETIERTHPDVIMETHIAFSLAGKIASEQTGVPLVIDDVAPAWEEAQQYGVGLNQTADSIYKQVTTTARLLIAVSPAIRDYLREQGLPKDRIVLVPNGIDASLFTASGDPQNLRARYNIPGNVNLIVFVGSFQPYHRVDLLIRAFAQVQSAVQCHLLLVGEGARMAECKALAEKLNLGNAVTFTGAVDYSQVGAYIAAADIAVLPGNLDYGNSMKIYEYLALGRPIVAPDQPTVTDMVTHNQTAYLFKREDVSSMTEALLTLIRDPLLVQRLSAEAGKLAAECTWEKRAAVLSNALETLY
jgi:glycosyltransferase involved in cell wall biosynthesis